VLVVATFAGPWRAARSGGSRNLVGAARAGLACFFAQEESLRDKLSGCCQSDLAGSRAAGEYPLGGLHRDLCRTPKRCRMSGRAACLAADHDRCRLDDILYYRIMLQHFPTLNFSWASG